MDIKKTKECKTFVRKCHNIKAHISSSQKCATFQCDYCEKTYTVKSNLIYHIRTKHMNSRTFQCDVCQKVCPYKRSFLRHKKIHEFRNHSFVCDYCGKLFLEKGYIRIHIKNKHSENKRRFECNICTSSFTSRYAQEIHVNRIHKKTNDETHTCEICGMKYKYRVNMLRHYRTIHLKRYNFTCDLCNKVYSKKVNLTTHMQKIHKFSTYVCDLCNIYYCSAKQLSHHSEKCIVKKGTKSERNKMAKEMRSAKDTQKALFNSEHSVRHQNNMSSVSNRDEQLNITPANNLKGTLKNTEIIEIQKKVHDYEQDLKLFCVDRSYLESHNDLKILNKKINELEQDISNLTTPKELLVKEEIDPINVFDDLFIKSEEEMF